MAQPATVADEFYYYTQKAGDVGRQLAFAGFAVVWLFRVEKNDQMIVPAGLLWPVVLITASLAMDVLQYVAGSAVWAGKFFKNPTANAQTSGTTKFLLGLVLIKLILLVVGYGWLLRVLVDRVLFK